LTTSQRAYNRHLLSYSV